ncbi:MAG: hypothetical protein K1060chlam2_01557 [Chlamydiae bacterium]|nr:hypothetical protein [Chlamydiota bacterium]
MGRLIMLIGVCLIIIGTLITLHIPFDWVGNLPGDFSLHWHERLIYVPITTSLVFSAFLSVLLFIFARR